MSYPSVKPEDGSSRLLANAEVPKSLYGRFKVSDYDIKHNTEAGKRFKKGNPAYVKDIN